MCNSRPGDDALEAWQVPDTARSGACRQVPALAMESIGGTVSRGRFSSHRNLARGCGTCGTTIKQLIRQAEKAWPDLDSWLTCPGCSEGYEVDVRVVMATELQRRLVSASTELQLWSLWQLGRAQLDAGSASDAQVVLQRAMQLSTQLHGSENSSTLAVASALGRSLSALGQHKEAEKVLRRTMQSHQRLSGDVHSDTLISTWCLCRALLLADSFDASCEAVVLVRRLVRTMHKKLGPRHPTTVDWATRLDGLLQEFALEEEAHRLRRAALAPEWFKDGGVSAAQMLPVLRKTYGAESEEYLSTANSWANELFRASRFSEAAGIQEEVAAALRRTLGAQHEITLAVLTNLACSYDKLQRHQEAKDLRREVRMQSSATSSKPSNLAKLCMQPLDNELVETAESARTARRMMDVALELAVHRYATSLEWKSHKADKEAVLARALASEPPQEGQGPGADEIWV